VISAVGLGIQQFHTHVRSNLESKPASDDQGNAVALDGRLDNCQELCALLGLPASDTSDSEIVLHAFERWGEDSFSNLVGEWAIAFWSATDESLYLARDHAGTRTLYFEQIGERILWSTYLDTFFANGAVRQPDHDYMAAYLSSQPTSQRTPYRGITGVAPGHFARFRADRVICKAHWHCAARSRLRYKSDLDYEEHFLKLFRQAVERRTGNGAATVAELSGGMDSTSIVCMSDTIRTGSSREQLLDTVSYFDDSDPDWNERPYFEAVERHRGKSGIHVNTSYLRRTFDTVDPCLTTYFFPGADTSTVLREMNFLKLTAAHPYRAILSGIGGDELLGGVPTPYPELADYLIAGRFHKLLRRSLQWALTNRRPLAHLLFETARFLPGLYIPCLAGRAVRPPWIVKREGTRHSACGGTGTTLAERFKLAPSQMSTGLTWNALIETLPSLHPAGLYRLEYRYPYLDRDLVEFLIAIPREQLVRPGRRRSLMRRALKNIVPEEILERRRKAFQLRAPLSALNSHAESIESMFSDSYTGRFLPVDLAALMDSFRTTCSGATPQLCAPLLKMVALELCLRSNSGLLESSGRAAHF
jgi:asparagine synthase (glutamine-hydrolysing)